VATQIFTEREERAEKLTGEVEIKGGRMDADWNNTRGGALGACQAKAPILLGPNLQKEPCFHFCRTLIWEKEGAKSHTLSTERVEKG